MSWLPIHAPQYIECAAPELGVLVGVVVEEGAVVVAAGAVVLVVLVVAGAVVLVVLVVLVDEETVVAVECFGPRPALFAEGAAFARTC